MTYLNKSHAALPRHVYSCNVCTQVVNVLCSSPTLTAKVFARFRAIFSGRLCYLKDVRDDADENVIVFILNSKSIDTAWPPSKMELAARVRTLQRKLPALLPFGLSLCVYVRLCLFLCLCLCLCVCVYLSTCVHT